MHNQPSNTVTKVFLEKLNDAWEIPGSIIECDFKDANNAGAFIENALDEADAIESAKDGIA